MRRQASIGNLSEKSDRMTSLSAKPIQLNAVEQLIAGKLGYEWKNIYRNFVQVDFMESGMVELREFDQICLKFKVSFSKEELKKLKGLFCENFDPNTPVHDMAPTHQDKDMINYKKLSMQLGLHKDSFNFVNGNLSA